MKGHSTRIQYTPGITSPPVRAVANPSRIVTAAKMRAATITCLVRDEGADTIGKFLDGIDTQGMYALVVTLAAMVPDDQPMSDLLAWIEKPLEAVA